MTEDAPFPIEVPACFSLAIRSGKNLARQLLLPGGRAALDVSASSPRLKRDDGSFVELVISAAELQPGQRALKVRTRNPERLPAILRDRDGLHWVGCPLPVTPAEIRATWEGCFNFNLGDRDTGRPGLRLPQLGAVHAVLGHWTTESSEPATVVMPTGTGKTETMLALLATARPERLLVVVPSDVLRSQISRKFECWGVLQESGVISPSASRPIVGQLKQGFATAEAACQFVEACNVVVTTPSALFASPSSTMASLLNCFSHLFVDEAHHVEATTWRRIRSAFQRRPVLQFTATPFREDGRRLAGRIVYAFPLRLAQIQGYFSRINYRAVVAFDAPDVAIATTAVERLRSDLAAGLEHILMARVRRIGRANEVKEIYTQLAPDLHPVVLHSSLSAHARADSLEKIRSGQSRIIVCVDMLGEGFDLPSLKVAAIHDPHKSLGITLQFVGRFARVAGSSIGEASVITSRPEGRYDQNLRRLYSEEPDWNFIIQDLSEAAIGTEHELSAFDTSFGALPEHISIRNIHPKMSTVIYTTHCDAWKPGAIEEFYPEEMLFTDRAAVNEESHVAWFVLEAVTPITWGELETVADVAYDLYLLYWDEPHQLLYVNSSNTESVHEELAKAVCGETVQRIQGEAVYRAMARVNRLVPTNVGLLDTRNRGRRFSLHVGADVSEGFPLAEAQTKTKTNIFAYGYEEGSRVSIGASLKGRIWSYRAAPTIKHWVDWCDHVGAKVVDGSVSVDEVIKGFIRPLAVTQRPPYVALGLEWPWEQFLNVSEETRVRSEGQEWPLVDSELEISDFSRASPISFNVVTPSWKAQYAMEFTGGSVKYRARGAELDVLSGKNDRPLSEFLADRGLTVLFEQDAMMVPPGILLKPDRDLPAFERERLVALDWSGIDLKKESQGPQRATDSIQARVIEYERELADWNILMDDDGSGEVADIVAMRVEDGRLIVELLHCKYSSELAPGGRVEDLYEVCGQAQKAIRWRRSVEGLFHTLIRREKNRKKRTGNTGFVVGDGVALYRLEERARLLRPDFRMVIAQPGLSKNAASAQQLELLASTEVYLQEVGNAPLRVLCSP